MFPSPESMCIAFILQRIRSGLLLEYNVKCCPVCGPSYQIFIRATVIEKMPKRNGVTLTLSDFKSKLRIAFLEISNVMENFLHSLCKCLLNLHFTQK